MRCSQDISKNAFLCSDFSGYVVFANYGFLIIELGKIKSGSTVYYYILVTTGLTPLYIHLSKIQHSV